MIKARPSQRPTPVNPLALVAARAALFMTTCRDMRVLRIPGRGQHGRGEWSPLGGIER